MPRQPAIVLSVGFTDMDFLLKNLGINPDEIKAAMSQFAAMANTTENRVTEIERLLLPIAQKLGVETAPVTIEHQEIK